MKKTAALLLFAFTLAFCMPAGIRAYEGYNGYDGGISSGLAAGKTSYKYQEVSFVTGEPIVYKGSLILKKSPKKDSITSTYTYDLKNTDRSAALKRTLVLVTTLAPKDNGQTVETTSISKVTETITVGSTTYSIKSADNYDYSTSTIIDPRPAVNYYSGNLRSTKVYQIGTANTTSASLPTVTVKATGTIVGYDNYWGSSEADVINYEVTKDKTKDDDGWGGTAKVTLSSSTIKKTKYVTNEPEQISFAGGYVQIQTNDSILEYTSSFPEMDAKTGKATDNMLSRSGSLELETYPQQTRLLVADVSSIKSHWAAKDIELLSGLEVIKAGDYLKPDQIITRSEFISELVQAAREVPADPALVTRIAAATRPKTTQVVSPFDDVSINNQYFNQIDNAVKRGIITGRGGTSFSPNDGIILADALTVFIRALGLENLSSGTPTVTAFKDNDLIPSYARSSVYVAQKIGLVTGDTKGYLKPNEKLTKARTAALFKNLITYMQDGITKDYRDRIVNYQ